MTIWRVRVAWVTIWYLTMNNLPKGKPNLTSSPGPLRYSNGRTTAKILGDAAKPPRIAEFLSRDTHSSFVFATLFPGSIVF